MWLTSGRTSTPNYTPLTARPFAPLYNSVGSGHFFEDFRGGQRAGFLAVSGLHLISALFSQLPGIDCGHCPWLGAAKRAGSVQSKI